MTPTVAPRAALALPRLCAMAAMCIGTTTCSGYFGDPPGATNTGAPPTGTVAFEAVRPAAYVTKIKTLLTGLPVTQAEIDAVTHDPSALRGLIDGWLQMPQAQTKLLGFFANAFQQTHLSTYDFSDQLRVVTNFPGPLANVIVQNFEESFARTVWELVMVQGHPFTEVLTTRTFMMTPALMAELLFISDWDGTMQRNADVYSIQDPSLHVVLEHNQGPIPISQTLDPNSPNYMHWYTDVPIVGSPGNMLAPTDPAYCGDPLTMPTGYAFAQSTTVNIFNVMHGGMSNFSFDQGPGGTLGHGCLVSGSTSPQFADSDLSDWRMVTINQPTPGQARTRFWDLPALRSATQLQLPQQRVGFFTTPAFFANWPTNGNNQHRVTMNQALIVGLGQSFDSSQTVVVAGLPTSTTFNASHASDPACASCHVVLDPMRQFFTRAYDFNNQLQAPGAMEATYGSFALDNVQRAGATLYDLADIMASHPRFAPAWVQKVCAWANSGSCADNDPQLLRIANAFQANHFNFRGMLVDVLASPVVTGAQATVTQAASGETITIARANHFCVALQNRLGVPNVCNVTSTASLVSSNIPSDGYSRGATEPFLPTDPQLFFRGAIENLCREIALQVVDAGPVAHYSTRNLAWSLGDMVRTVMNIPDGSARSGPLLQILNDHFNDSLAAGATQSDALRSTFVLACTSPTSAAIGL